MPYRNSMMTTLLKDSLGGNCRTAMVANISGDPAQLEESLSTCRFAQAVACISNQVCTGTARVCLFKLLPGRGQLDPVLACRAVTEAADGMSSDDAQLSCRLLSCVHAHF